MNRLAFIQQHIHSQPICYSLPIASNNKAQTAIYRNPQSLDGLTTPPPGINSLADWWDQLLTKFPNHQLIQDWTYNQCDTIAKNVGSWILGNNHSKVYLYATNRPQWTIVDIAGLNYGFVTIPLYDTLGSQAFQHTVKLTQGTLMITTESLCTTLISYLKKFQSRVKEVLVLDPPSVNTYKILKQIGVKVYYFGDIAKDQRIIKRPPTNLDSHLTYAFTSGTTGLPKGAIITHRNIITQVTAMKDFYEFLPTDVHMSYLPIAHSFERFVVWNAYNFACNIRYSKYPPTQILKDLAAIKPTTIPIVPRLLNKLYSVLKPMYDKQKNKSKIKAIFGGRMRKIVCGSAPISPEVLSFFKETLECDIIEGYGQTQTNAASFVTSSSDSSYGHVGGPNRATQFKLVDVPEMQYFTSSNPPKGEVCTRGPSIFVGYYRNQQNTKQTLDSEGWNHSGDIGVILPNGALKIIDRKKNIYKLSQGEYIAPQKIQNIYLRCKYVAQCFLYGDSLKDYNIAIVHPALDQLPTLAKTLGIAQANVGKLCDNEQITSFILKEMTNQGKADGLAGFQLARKIRLSPVPFGTYSIFTSTMKLQRHIAKEAYQEQIKKLYID